jgi:hypothetical protein
MLDVVVKEEQRDAIERCLDRLDLRQDVNAVTLVIHHPLEPASLSFDSKEPLLYVVLVRDVTCHDDQHTPSGYAYAG